VLKAGRRRKQHAPVRERRAADAPMAWLFSSAAASLASFLSRNSTQPSSQRCKRVAEQRAEVKQQSRRAARSRLLCRASSARHTRQPPQLSQCCASAHPPEPPSAHRFFAAARFHAAARRRGVLGRQVQAAQLAVRRQQLPDGHRPHVRRNAAQVHDALFALRRLKRRQRFGLQRGGQQRRSRGRGGGRGRGGARALGRRRGGGGGRRRGGRVLALAHGETRRGENAGGCCKIIMTAGTADAHDKWVVVRASGVVNN
jgi:hypothetical protein